MATGHDMITAVRAALGDPERRTKGFPWLLIRLTAWAWPMMREVQEMRYLWTEEVVMDGTRLARTLEQVPKTPLVDALRHDLDTLRAAA